jgi:hypothetical protein
MRKLLNMMKAKEKHLAAKASTQLDEIKLERLHKEIHMLHAQRKKGISALKILNKEQKSKHRVALSNRFRHLVTASGCFGELEFEMDAKNRSLSGRRVRWS